MDAPEILTGKRGRAADIPTQSADKESRLSDLRLAFAGCEEVVKEHAQW